jgi:glutathione S-transferase
MKLYSHPFSTAGRPVRLLLAEKGIACEEVLVDLMQGAHHQEPYASLNPSKMVPMLEDDGFRLTESSAILKYLADKHDLPEYPKDLRARARVNEAMDFLNTQFYRDFGYGVVYPQLFPHHKRRSDEAHAACIEWGQAGAKRWLAVLNDHWLGSGIVSIGELIGCDFAEYPNVRAWLGRLKQLRSWKDVNAAFEGAVAGNQGKEFARV